MSKLNNKIDVFDSVENKNQSHVALKKAKELEAQYKNKMTTIKISNTLEVSSNKKSTLNTYLKNYGKL